MKKEEIDAKLKELTVNGEHLSPVLPEGIKNYLIDIDGTICDDIPNEEPERMATANVYPDALETLINGMMKVMLFSFLLLVPKSIELLQRLGYNNMALNITEWLWVNHEVEITTGLIII